MSARPTEKEMKGRDEKEPAMSARPTEKEMKEMKGRDEKEPAMPARPTEKEMKGRDGGKERKYGEDETSEDEEEETPTVLAVEGGQGEKIEKKEDGFLG